MADKLEVLAGPGLVARFGEVVIWAGPQATAALQAHLVSEAQRLALVQAAGDLLANSLIAVLQRGDPEPQSPFAIIGPGSNGLTLFLHGPVQAWDSGRWLVPQPVPGWMMTPVARPWPLIVLPYGAAPPPQSQHGNPLDLQSGAVPGSGFILLRPPSGPPQVAAGGAGTGTAGQSYAQTATAAGSGTGPLTAQPAPSMAVPSMAVPSMAVPSLAAASGPTTSSPTATAAPAGAGVPGPAAAPPAAPAGTAPVLAGDGPIDLRAAPLQASFPLPGAGLAARDRPEAVGVTCPRGHWNHPHAQSCARCGAPLTAGSPQVNGPRPPVGVLLADDGSIYCLSIGCLIGSDPTAAPEVVSGAMRPITMRAGPNHTMGPVQAAVQVRGWDAYLEDRAGGSYVQGAEGEGWSALSLNEQRELASGSHISCGGRVLTFLSAWPA